MNARQADDLGCKIALLLAYNQHRSAYEQLEPIIEARTPFRLLDRIGSQLSATPFDQLDPFNALIAAGKSEGGWVVVASSLTAKYFDHPEEVFNRAHDFIVQADVWYAADITSERVPGPALVKDFDQAIDLLADWRTDGNRWVRRSVGVAAHYWAKKSNADPKLHNQATALLGFTLPMFSEWEMDATKGIAWGLKTIGRNYPDLMAEWLVTEALPANPKYRAHMLRKASLYLSDEQRALVEDYGK